MPAEYKRDHMGIKLQSTLSMKGIARQLSRFFDTFLLFCIRCRKVLICIAIFPVGCWVFFSVGQELISQVS